MTKNNSTMYLHAGREHDAFGALTTPTYGTSTFVFDTAEQGARRFAGEEPGYIYSRLGNPTVAVAEAKLAMMEGAEAAVCTSSGMGAITAVFWTLLKAGDHVVSGDTIYGCTYKFIADGLTRFGIDVTFVDTSDTNKVAAALRPNTRIVFLETPANPSLKVSDIESIAIATHKINDCVLIVDSTFSSPHLTRPLDFGADVVVHSATKFLNGHGDIVSGFAAGKADLMLRVRLEGIKDLTGAVPSPHDVALLIRGMKTLELRMERHCANAKRVVEFLCTHEDVETVYYPGLPAHPNHDIAKKQMRDFGGVVAFELKGGISAGVSLLNNLKLCALAVSLGHCGTLIQHPASMTHSAVPPEERRKAGISDGLVRMSVGLEDPDDIVADLAQALKASHLNCAASTTSTAETSSVFGGD